MSRTERWTASPGLRAGLLALLLVAVSLALVVLNLRATATVSGDAAWMNTAGSCHEHTYRIIYLAHRLFDEHGRAPGVVRDQLKAPQLGRGTAFRVRLPLHAESPRRVED